VEDACQQPGADLDGRKVGTWGDVGVLSFGGSKLLTAGRGGAVLTDDAVVRQRMKVYSEQGNQAFPLSELQAAALRPQLAQLDERNAIRRGRVSLLREAIRELSDWLRPVSVRLNSQPTYFKHAWSLVPAESDPELRQSFLATVQAAGAPIDAGFRGFSGRGKRRCEKPVPLSASAALSQSTVLLHHPMLLAHEKAAHQLADVLIHSVQQLVR
jgi:perosamine synthetase